MSLVEDIITSSHNENVAYAVFDNHKRGDYKPYVFKTTNKGKSWKAISNDLPAWGTAHTIAEDHVNSNLLFVGTEYGLFVTQNGGKNWSKMTGGLPTISVRDIEIQRRESDLVVGTFGRGIYIVDDYSPLRTQAKDLKKAAATLFPIKDPWLYLEGNQYGNEKKGSNGNELYTANNPTYGAVFSYYLKDSFKTLKEQRRDKEKVLEKEGKDTPYPSWDALRKEDNEEGPSVYVEVKDSQGNVVRRVSASSKKGFHRAAWDMRYPSFAPVKLTKPTGYIPPWGHPPKGPLALPGEYTATLMKRQLGKVETLGKPQSFTVKLLNNSKEITTDRKALLAAQMRSGDLYRKVQGAARTHGELKTRIAHIKQAIVDAVNSTEAQAQKVRKLNDSLTSISILLSGDRTISSRQEPVPWSVRGRASSIYGAIIDSQFNVSGNHLASLKIAETEYQQVATQLQQLNKELNALETEMDNIKAPWTPGRVPTDS